MTPSACDVSCNITGGTAQQQETTPYCTIDNKLDVHVSHVHGAFITRVIRLLSVLSSGRSGLAVACLTAVREVPGSTRAVGSCVYRTTTVIYSLGHGLCAPFLQCQVNSAFYPTWDGK